MATQAKAIKEGPIIFSGPMVRAIDNDRKTHTRRMKGLEDINERPDAWGYDGENIHGDHLFFNVHAAIVGHEPPDCVRVIRCPYGKPSDRLWVRETHAIFGIEENRVQVAYAARLPEGKSLADTDGGLDLIHLEDPKEVKWAENHVDCERWRPSIFMKRWSSRTMLEIKHVRAERLQEISVDNIKAEGVLPPDYPNGTYIAEFDWEGRVWRELWNKINGKKHPWDSNPWVWVIEFRRLVNEPESVTRIAATT